MGDLGFHCEVRPSQTAWPSDVTTGQAKDARRCRPDYHASIARGFQEPGTYTKWMSFLPVTANRPDLLTASNRGLLPAVVVAILAHGLVLLWLDTEGGLKHQARLPAVQMSLLSAMTGRSLLKSVETTPILPPVSESISSAADAGLAARREKQSAREHRAERDTLTLQEQESRAEEESERLNPKIKCFNSQLEPIPDTSQADSEGIRANPDPCRVQG